MSLKNLSWAWVFVALAPVFYVLPANAAFWDLDPSQCSESPDSSCVAGFDARVTFTFSAAAAADQIAVEVNLENRTVFDPGVDSNAPLAAFGFSVVPGLGNDADGVDDGVTADGALPDPWQIHFKNNGFNVGFLDNDGPAEACLSIDSSCFGTDGNSAASLDPGESATFNLLLDNALFLSPSDYEVAFLDGNPIFFRFKPLIGDFADPGSLKFGGTPGENPEVPEPGAMALFGIGIVGMVSLRRRRRNAG